MSSPTSPLLDPQNIDTAILQSIACLSSLPAETLTELARTCRNLDYATGDIVGGPAAHEDSVALVGCGKVRVSRPADRHGDIAFHDVPAGEIFGHLEALAGQTPQISAVAMTDARIALMPAATFLALLDAHPVVAVELLRVQAREAVSNAPRAPHQAGDGSYQLYAELLQMAEADPQAPGQLAITRLPRHRELAEWTGLTEGDVAAALAGLVKSGCAERRYPGLVILDADQLRQLATEGTNANRASRPRGNGEPDNMHPAGTHGAAS